ncbi:MBL fold metallo-hydrolase [Taklimakanibacter deserti]|uniref:MBL fold metallo-hydrolase n=1 Tax=Taklimakanibacter deserti TaxID=2267839 RepID=UPI0013C42573
MRFRIHRGATEIGGNCVEVQSAGKSLFLDLGLPLDADGPDRELLPPVAGLANGSNPDLVGIVLSHPHGDHYGLLASCHPSIPVFMGDGARKLLNAAAPFTTQAFPQKVTIYRNRETLGIGPFLVTPYLMDHSGFDAYCVLVEADGRRLLYSGDFRAHGRKTWAFDSFLSQPPDKVDALLMEGTVIGRQWDPEPVTEAQLETSIAASISSTKGLVLACFSAQNIDRFVTCYKATLRSGRQLIVDVYMAGILDGLALQSLPMPSSGTSGIRVFLPKRQKLQIVRGGRFDLVDPYRSCRIYSSEIGASPERWVMMFRGSMVDDVEKIGALGGGRLIWSLWPGYLDRGEPDLRKWCEKHGMGFEIQHTSGHAHVSDLVEFANRIAARMVVPIHTLHPNRFSALFSNVIMCVDGQWCDLN